MSSCTSNTLPSLLRAASTLAALLLSTAGFSADERPAAKATFGETVPVTVSRERQVEFTSAINGQPYRLMISAPRAEPGKRYPVLFVLDGNWYFRAASDTVTAGSGKFDAAIVVGIGYPTEDRSETGRRRHIDYTVVAEPAYFPHGSGGCDAFLRIIEEEIKPYVASLYPVDPARYMLYGKSIGGLTVLRALFRTPENFSTYMAVSPSIWQGDRAVLADEARFAEKVRSGALQLRLLITAASGEDYTGTDPALRAENEANGPVNNARNLADRLKVLNPEKVPVHYVLFQDESHNTVSLAALARAITFALPAPPPQNLTESKK